MVYIHMYIFSLFQKATPYWISFFKEAAMSLALAKKKRHSNNEPIMLESTEENTPKHKNQRPQNLQRQLKPKKPINFDRNHIRTQKLDLEEGEDQ